MHVCTHAHDHTNRFDIPHYNPKVDIDLQLNQTDDAAVDTEAAEEETLTSPASA